MNVMPKTPFQADPTRYEISPAERDIRVQLAAAFRVAHHYRWNLQVLNHMAARIPDRPDLFLMNPLGLGWDEITASSLVTARLEDGAILSHTGVKLAPAGLNFHSGILRERPDVHCTIHVHPTAGVVIAATQQGLFIVDQSGCYLHGQVGTHDFEGFAQEEDEVPRILRDLGDKPALIMWNHGLLTTGRSIAEAFQYMRRLVDACELQERLMATGAEIRRIPDDVLEHTKRQIDKKRQNPGYSEPEWKYHLRVAQRIDPSFAD